MYIEMNENMQRYNTFRNRWVGAYLADKGIRVIPTVSWGLENTFDFCFNGIEKGGTVAVSTYMASAHGNRADQKDFFMAGYNEMLKRIEPEKIICYHYPFPEMEGNILFVDYDLSSWQHYEDDKLELPYTQMEKYALGINTPSQNSNIVVKFNDNSLFTFKGNGSVFGGQWRPHPDKPWEERFFGKPGEIKHTFIPTAKGGYWADTKIGEDGRAETERHYSDHGYPALHSNPHDTYIGWNAERGFPEWGEDINYFDGDIPEFKFYKKTRISIMNMEYNFDYKTKYEFIESVQRHSEIVFEWNEKEYGLFYIENKRWVLCIDKTGLKDVFFDKIEDLLNYKIGDDKFIDICTKITVIERTF